MELFPLTCSLLCLFLISPSASKTSQKQLNSIVNTFSNFFPESKCVNGDDESSFVHELISQIVSERPKEIRLPRRLLGNVYLKRGFIYGLETMRLSEEPVLLFCHNQTLGAIQPKLVLDNVTFLYEWVYGDDESHGIATTPTQRMCIDIDIEQSEDTGRPSMLGLYVTKITNTKFNVVINSNKQNLDVFDQEYQVALAGRTFISRDAGLAMTMEISPRVTDFLFNSRLSVG